MTQNLSFEEARQELERIVAQLESGQAGLEDALALWERGEELYRLCVGKLDAAHAKVEELGGKLSPPATAERRNDGAGEA